MSKATLIELTGQRYSFRVRWKEGGKTIFKYFKAGERKKADGLVALKNAEMMRHGAEHGTVDDAERAALILFRTSTAAMPEPRPTLMDAVSAFLASKSKTLLPILVCDLVDRRAAAAKLKGVHQRTLRDLVGTDGRSGRLGEFANAFGTRQAATITMEEIELWLDGKGVTNATRREILVRVGGLFAFGVRKGFLSVNPLAGCELPRPNPPQAAILTPQQAGRLLNACSARILPAVAVQLFGGLRFAEVERLQWNDLETETGLIRVTQHKGAGGKRQKLRFPPMLPTLKAWLPAVFPATGFILPHGRNQDRPSGQIYRTDFQRARLKAGIEIWDENTLRHSFGTYRTAVTDLDAVRAEMGHSDARTTQSHYINNTRRSEALAFWALRPSGEKRD